MELSFDQIKYQPINFDVFSTILCRKWWGCVTLNLWSEKISMYKNVCVQIWKPGNDHSTKLNIIAIFSNYCIIPIQSMHDFFDTQNNSFSKSKKIFFESLDELKMKLISILHNTLKGFNFINVEFELLYLKLWYVLYDKLVTNSTLNY